MWDRFNRVNADVRIQWVFSSSKTISATLGLGVPVYTAGRAGPGSDCDDRALPFAYGGLAAGYAF